ncbi:hypothetical protein R3W88_022592 [Solanum pinnatisectum]|uniref:Uncharacterized protein n=1 Tax=Solanum pinnatisectum TaxID=50273 RepID=A0AAV9LYF0_9SOLN|nr:hypothetical protein R3W88_022592 [Solanum pinnatisectum]
MKELVTKKTSLDFETIKVSHSCSGIITKERIKKREDPKAFTIPCTISMLQFAKAPCDLGASINLMPYAIYKQLGLGEPKATTMGLLIADRSIEHPVGILYDILIKVDRFIFPTNFFILNCEIEAEIPIILGRPFLATERALVDVESRELNHLMCMSEPLEVVLANYDESEIQGYEEVVAALSGLGGEVFKDSTKVGH